MSKFSDKYGKLIRISSDHKTIVEAESKKLGMTEKSWLESIINKNKSNEKRTVKRNR